MLRRIGSSVNPRACTAVVAVVLTAVAVGCGREDDDLVNGKTLFIERCGSCHALDRADTSGTAGPDLDASFRTARNEGIGEKTIAGVVEGQIAHPGRSSGMPADLVTGDDAEDVAAYVAEVAGAPGEDTGRLADAGLAGATSGEQIFKAAGCGGCHTLAAAGTTASAGPALSKLADDAQQRAPGMSLEEFIRESIVQPDERVAPGFSAGQMPDEFREKLSKQQLDALVDYLARVSR